MTDFAKDVRERWKAAEEADAENRKEALADLKFEAGEHWDERVKAFREEQGVAQYGFPLPCLTVHTIPQFINQVVGDRMANATSIKVLPREDGDKDVAEIRGELIRSIELQSKAERVYAQVFGQAVSCGIGNFRIDLEYAYEDAFERDLFIRSIPNPLAVLWDPFAADPTGRDAEWCFVSDKIQKDEYKRRYKGATEGELTALGLEADGWVDGESVRVAEYWEMFEREKEIGMTVTGAVVDMTGKKPGDVQLAVNPSTGQPYTRKAACKYARMTLTNGKEELSDPLELKLHRLPIIRVTGREVWVGDKRVRYGLTRFARDPARLKDYFRSVRAELLMLAPRANWIAAADAIEGRTNDWKNTLVHNQGTQAPTPATRDNLAALLTEEQFCTQDLKEVTGIHEAELGMRSNETSGIAIQRRQQQGDIATIAYSFNMNSAQQEAGEVVNALLDVTHDTARTIRTVGVDDAVKVIRINDPKMLPDGNPDPNKYPLKENDPNYQADMKRYADVSAAVDLSRGRYDVTISTGPAYATQRQEQATTLMELATRNQKFAEVVPDYLVRALDIKHGDEMAERFKRTIPPEILGDEKDDDKSPEELQAAAAKAQEAQQLQQAQLQFEMRIKAAEADEAEANAAKARFEARKAEIEAGEMEAGLTLKGAALAEHATEVEEMNELGEMI